MDKLQSCKVKRKQNFYFKHKVNSTNEVSTSDISVTAMALKTLIVFAVLTVALHQGDASNEDKYCGEDACPGGQQNIGCGCDSSSYGPQCAGKNPSKIKLDGTLKALVLKEHNTRRDMLACGSVAPHAAAARMSEVTWDNELEFLAECNAIRCTYGHDQCRSTREFPYAGQNIASMLICGSRVLKPEEMILQSMDAWFQEYKNTTPAMIDEYPAKPPRDPIGHFTVIVNDNLERIGCSYVEFEEGKRNNQNCRKYIFICNYSYTNFVEEKTYIKTGEPAKECLVRSDQYPCLCGSKLPAIPV